MPRRHTIQAFDLAPTKVYVVVKVYRGIGAEETRAFETAEPAKRLYRKFARECRVPYDRTRGDYDWSRSDYTAWWTPCPVEK